MKTEELKNIKLELHNEEVLLRQYKAIYNCDLQDSQVHDLARSIDRESRENHQYFDLIVEERIKEIETHITELQEKIDQLEK